MRRFQALALSLVLFAGFSVAQPPRAHAIVGAMISGASTGAAIPFFVAAGISGGMALREFLRAANCSGSCTGFGQLPLLVSSMAYLGLGVILLDADHGAPDVAFAPITARQARSLGVSVSSDDLIAYDDELEELNAARESILASVRARDFESTEALVSFIQGEWADLKHEDLFSEGAIRVAEAVSERALQAR